MPEAGAPRHLDECHRTSYQPTYDADGRFTGYFGIITTVCPRHCPVRAALFDPLQNARRAASLYRRYGTNTDTWRTP